jgi:ribulose-5-phosphate 4-epimerase/fuculose-1-phosphate aldolase
MTPEEEDAKRSRDLVTANRILADQGILDAFGHVSVRSARDPGRYLMSRSSAPALVTLEDIMEFDLDSTPVDPRGRKMYAERCIHGEIFRARPDVQAVVHSHSPAVIPYGVTGQALKPICHMASFLRGDVPVFEIRDVEGDDNALLVVKNATAAALAKTLGDSAVVLMRGHGNAVVAGSLKLAVYRAIYTELNARIQAESLRMGSVKYLTAREAQNFQGVFEGSDANLERPWEIWERQVNAAR